MNQHQEPRASEYHNVASANSKVSAQVNVLHGDLHVRADTETPEEKAERAELLLGKGMTRDAERLFADAIGRGCTGSRVAYWWALAILDGRSQEQVVADHLDNLDAAFRMVSQEATDTWSQALQVVMGLFDRLGAVGGQTEDTLTSQSEALAAYDQLDPERAAEIRRYLDQVLDGVVLEHIQKAAAEEARRERLANKRDERAWKFFEPIPSAPEWLPPPSRPRRLWAWLKLTPALAVAGIAVLLVVPEIIQRGGGSLVPGISLLVFGLAGVVYYGLQRRFVLDEREIEQRMFTLPMEGDLPWYAEGQAKFAERMVAGAFNRCAPSPAEKKIWKQATKRYQLNLTRQFVELYEAPEVRRRPSVVRWLAHRHAKQLAERWDPEDPEKLCVEIKVPGRLYLGMALTAAAMSVGAALLWWPLLADGASVGGMIMPILITSGLRVAVDQSCWLISSARAYAKDIAASNRRYRGELASYHELRDLLADRPDDVEMASWLDYDEHHLRAEAMELYQITNPELIAHVTFAAPADDARHMTEPGGPKRYTEYIIGVMLMTRGGVRMAEFHLDMCTGEVRDPARRSFGYGAIASVHVRTARVDRDYPSSPGSKKRNSDKHGREDSKEELPMEKPGLRTTIRVVLVNGAPVIEALFDVFDDEIEDARQEPHALVARALDVSGVAGALWMMEAITADGKGWVEARERRRQHRRHQSWRQPDTETGAEANGKSHVGEGEPVPA